MPGPFAEYELADPWVPRLIRWRAGLLLAWSASSLILLLANQVGRTFRAQVPVDEQAAVLDAVRAELRALRTDGQLTLPGAAWIVTARLF